MNTQLFTLSGLLAAFLLATNLACADTQATNIQAKNQREAAAKAANEGHAIRAKAFAQPVQPNGTPFLITTTHPDSNWQAVDFQGSILTATTCHDDPNTTGINLITAGARKDWYEACFTKPGNPEPYYVYGFQYTLATATPAPDTFDETTGILTLPAVKVGEETYSAVLVFEGNNLFRLQSAGPKPNATSTNVADSFDAASGKLALPAVKVGAASYAAVLRLVDNPYFRLESVTQH